MNDKYKTLAEIEAEFPNDFRNKAISDREYLNIRSACEVKHNKESTSVVIEAELSQEDEYEYEYED